LAGLVWRVSCSNAAHALLCLAVVWVYGLGFTVQVCTTLWDAGCGGKWIAIRDDTEVAGKVLVF
jgi:hypothetical protein